jgi:Rrf2 family transcriptional regulator, cysteine metabolism repressor
VKLSVKSDYAARAVLALARHYPDGGARRVEELAAPDGIPANYLVQILIELKAKGIVRSVRGKAGGYLLARPPTEITMGDILRALHGELLDTPALSDASCPAELRRAWTRLRTAFEQAADSITMQQLLDEGAGGDRMYFI